MATIDQYEIRQRVYRDRWGRAAGSRVFCVPQSSMASLMADVSLNTLWPSSYTTWTTEKNWTAGTIVEYLGNHYIAVTDLTNSTEDPATNNLGDQDEWIITLKLLEKQVYDRTVDRMFPGMPGKSRIIANYETPTLSELSHRGENRGVLYLKIEADAESPLVDTTGAVITGVDLDDANYTWMLVNGTNILTRPKCGVRIHCAVANPNVNTYSALIGRTNNASLTNLGSAAAGTMLMLGVELAGEVTDTGLMIADIYMEYDSEGFATRYATRKFEIVTKQITDATGEKRLIRSLKPAAAATTPSLFAQADFSAINALLTW